MRGFVRDRKHALPGSNGGLARVLCYSAPERTQKGSVRSQDNRNQNRKVNVREALDQDAPGISQVCSAGWRETYRAIYSQTYINWVINEFYNLDRLKSEIQDPGSYDRWLVAEEKLTIVGAAGGGLTSPEEWEIFVLYLDPLRRRQGIGTLLLNALTDQATRHGATEQWVSVTQGNRLGIPFYETRGFVLRSEHSIVSPPTGETLLTLRYSRKIA